jgi:hypothetical protein
MRVDYLFKTNYNTAAAVALVESLIYMLNFVIGAYCIVIA